MRSLPRDVIVDALREADAAIVVSSVGGIQYANQAFARLIGVPEQELLGVRLAAIADADTMEALSVVLEEVLVLGVQARTHDVALRTSDGGLTLAEHRCRALDVSGQRFAVSTFADRGDRGRPGESLASAGPRHRDLPDDETDGRFLATPDWRLMDCNTAFARMLGYDDRSQLAGRNLLDITPDAPILQKWLAVTRAGGDPGRVELKMDRADAAVIDVSLLAVGSTREDGSLVSLRGQVVEITDRKRFEARRQGAERMEAIGRLAGGFAHDFNNLLTVISGNSERLLDVMADADPLRGAVAAIDQAAARAASMTRQLLAYGRRQVFELQPVSLQTLIAGVRPLVAEILGEDITLQVSLPSELPQMSADPRQIERVIANLARNARESMPSGGTLTIAVDATEVGGNALRERGWLRQGRYVRLTVADTGGGMDPVTKAHAFQPFFTTKRMGDGRGLGLATVYGIVKQSNGFVWVESAIGQGATFTLLFPVIKEKSDAEASAQGDVGETVLIVEEDAATRTFAGEALRRRGYRVLDVASGADAFDRFTSHPSRIHLAVFNSRAVTAQGLPLAARLQAIDPLVQSLVMLDAPATSAGSRGVLPTTPSIQKPFTLQALADKVRQVLDSGEGRG